MTQESDKGVIVEIAAIFDQALDEIFPAEALECLPFTAQKVNDWTIGNDLGRFITALLKTRVGALFSDGAYMSRSAEEIAPSSFQRERRQAIKLRKLFVKRINKEFGDIELCEAELGRALKYVAAWNAVSNAILEESAFTSLPHVLEGSADLESIVRLLAWHFYKQTSQVLRSFLEGQVVDLTLARNDADFASWKAGTYKVPNIRGAKGLLTQAVSRGDLTNEMKERIDVLLDQLNASVHGAERTLIHSDTFTGRHSGHAFRLDKFLLAATLLAEVVEICLHVMRVKTAIWGRILKAKTDKCEICREPTLTDIAEFEFGNRIFVLRRCPECGHKSTVRKDDGARVYVISRAFGPDPFCSKVDSVNRNA
jgi:hypothetical protein